MAALNSLLLLLTTLSPLDSPDSSAIPFETTTYPWQIYKETDRTCPLNELYDECGTACPKTCSNWSEDIPCTQQCVKGCFCAEGMVRGEDGKCIWPRQCSPPSQREIRCHWTEVYDKCGTACPKNCSNYNDDTPCTLPCVEGCFCSKGMVRNKNGRCIWPRHCPHSQGQIPIPVICKRDEVMKVCSSPCPDSCDNYKDPDRKCKKKCIPGCECKTGLIKGPSGHCIKPEKCPRRKPDDCWESEYFNPCGTCEDNCTTYGQPDRACDKKCVPGCYCKAGSIRGRNGECIWPFECWFPSSSSDSFDDSVLEHSVAKEAKKCPVNELYLQCGTACPKNCSNWKDETKPCTQQCVPGCFCKGARIRGSDGKCVFPNQCPKSQSESAAEFSSCQLEVSGNGAVGCSGWSDRVICDISCDGRNYGKYICISGEWSRILPSCVHPKDSFAEPTQCGVNEEFKVCSDKLCQPTCDNYTTPRACPFICIPGCNCLPEHVRGPDGTCIKTEECYIENSFPEPTQCGVNEEFKVCSDKLCQPTCNNYTTPIPCPLICIPGCSCLPEHVRGPDGTCIKTEECPSKDSFTEPTQCGVNEEFKVCSDKLCQPTCNNFLMPRPCPLVCIEGCNCLPDHVRGPDGTCIKTEECYSEGENQLPVSGFPNLTICTGKQVFRACKNLCPSTCENPGFHKPCMDMCIPGCDCYPGLVRSSEGECIDADDCQTPQENQFPIPFPTFCGATEVFKGCKNFCPPTCENPGIDKPCLQICVPGCDCVPGLLRSEAGKCVEPYECEQQSADRKCPMHEKYDPIFKRCDCEDGFVRDASDACRYLADVIPVETLREDEPDKCKENEIYKECGSVCTQNCDIPEALSEKRCDELCYPGCFCKPGYLRGPQGACIKPDECPK